MHTHIQRLHSWYTRRSRRELLLLALFVSLSLHLHVVQTQNFESLRGWILADASPDRATDTIAPLSTHASRRLTRLMRRKKSAVVKNAPLHGAAETKAMPNNVETRNLATLPFPAFGSAVFPVASVPNWGAMTTPAEWNRRFEELPASTFLPLPAYDLTVLTQPMPELLRDRWNHVDRITAKLTYSTRYFGAYDIDAAEFTGNHPGIDIKLAEGTPVGSVAGGRVVSVVDRLGLGRTVIVEHRHPSGETFYSVYGHLETAAVQPSQEVRPGDTIGAVGMTGRSTAPHLHLQIDRGEPDSAHEPYFPFFLPSPQEADRGGIHPIDFVQRFGTSPEETVAVNRP